MNRPQLGFEGLHRSVIAAHAAAVAPPRCRLVAAEPPWIKSRIDNGSYLRKKHGTEPPFQCDLCGALLETDGGGKDYAQVLCRELFNNGIDVGLNVNEVVLLS